MSWEHQACMRISLIVCNMRILIPFIGSNSSAQEHSIAKSKSWANEGLLNRRITAWAEQISVAAVNLIFPILVLQCLIDIEISLHQESTTLRAKHIPLGKPAF